MAVSGLQARQRQPGMPAPSRRRRGKPTRSAIGPLTGRRSARLIGPGIGLLTLGLMLHSGPSARASTCASPTSGGFDLIVYGDEPPGLLAALAVAAQPSFGASGRPARVAVVRDEPATVPLGGTVSRGGLAYLDRNQLPWDQWIWRWDHLAPSSRLYRQFLSLSGTSGVAADPRRVDRGFRSALAHHRVELLSGAGLQGVRRQGRWICGLNTRRYGELQGRYVIDSSLGADLAHRSGVAFSRGLGPGALADASLSLGWIFELRGLDLDRFRDLERHFSQRLLDPSDHEAQAWLQAWPAYRRQPEALRRALLDPLQQPRVAISWTADSADQVSPALAIAFHGESGLPPGLATAPSRLDLANIARLPDRLSLNALLLRNNAEQNRRVLAAGGRPLPWMHPYRDAVSRFFLRHGATEVLWSPRLYVRVADQIRWPRQVLSAELMAAGGVPAQESVGTFTYSLDIRGGLPQRVRLPHGPLTFNLGFRHTLPQELDNLAVLGPAGGFGGLGVGAGRILELNVTVAQGLACAITLASPDSVGLGAIEPSAVQRALTLDDVPYGRPIDEAPLAALGRWWRHGTSTLIHRATGSQLPALATPPQAPRCHDLVLSTRP